MRRCLLPLLFALLLSRLPLAAEVADPFDLYDWMAALEGEWVLSPADKQSGTESYKHPAVLPLVGTDTIGISFKQIGRNSTLQEDLLPDTEKRMVTMYHCSDVWCSNIKATHYCIKLNQPEFLANLEESTPTRIVFDCDMETSVCQSDEDHVHQIIHEISEEGNHLKTSYLSWKNREPIEGSSIYHFDRKETGLFDRLLK
jgi:hypothetical protein